MTPATYWRTPWAWTDVARFDIDIATGQLKTKGKLDREAITDEEKTYAVTVTAMDPFGITDAAMVTIEVKNEDESPVIGARRHGDDSCTMEPVVPANADLATLATYTATDGEDDAAATDTELTWSLKGAGRRTKFTIGNDIGDRRHAQVHGEPGLSRSRGTQTRTTYTKSPWWWTDSDDNADELAVRVEVENVKEDGVVTFSVNTPRVGVPVTAMLEDPDGGETGHEWQWMMAETMQTPP